MEERQFTSFDELKAVPAANLTASDNGQTDILADLNTNASTAREICASIKYYIKVINKALHITMSQNDVEALSSYQGKDLYVIALKAIFIEGKDLDAALNSYRPDSIYMDALQFLCELDNSTVEPLAAAMKIKKEAPISGALSRHGINSGHHQSESSKESGNEEEDVCAMYLN